MNSDRSLLSKRERRLMVVAAVGTAVAIVAGPLAAGAVIAGAALLVRVRAVVAARQLDVARARRLPDAIELLTLLVEAGRTPREAVDDLAQNGPDVLRAGFAAVTLRCQRGDDFATALGAVSEHLGPRASPLVDTLAAAERYGAPLAPALEVLRREARLQRQRMAEADARRLPVRLAFPLVLCTLPAFALLGIAPALLAALGSLGDLGL